MSRDLRVLFLNVWGLPQWTLNLVYSSLKAPVKEDRMRRIGATFSAYDLVSLCEVWCESDRQILISCGQSHGLVHSHYFTHGTFGTGVLLLSRHPISDVLFVPYRASGFPHRVLHGDWFAGRGACMGEVVLAGGQRVRVWGTHLHAQYVDDSGDDYVGHRAMQANELARCVRCTSLGFEGLVLVVGDMNSRPETLPIAVLKAEAGLVDAFTEKGKGPSFTIHHDITAPQRIDYIFYRPSPGFALESARVTMNGWASGKTAKYKDKDAAGPFPKGQEEEDDDFMYSDHFGVAATFSLLGAGQGSKAAPAADLPKVRRQLEELVQRELVSSKERYTKGVRQSLALTAVLIAIAAWTSTHPPSGTLSVLATILVTSLLSVSAAINTWWSVVECSSDVRACESTIAELRVAKR